MDRREHWVGKNVKPELARLNGEIQKLNRDYMTAQMEFDKERVFYPDANSTLRITYGTVKGYTSKPDSIFNLYPGFINLWPEAFKRINYW
jgi:hypothetical protein